ncbi:MAG: hypothetical protein H6839_10365 [Planctomycetes bacterium]|nr:hypothetical protein [Planctomycetota bacterium]
MRAPVSQFLFWFLISFSPAPVVGIVTYVMVHAHESPDAVEVRPAAYGAPQVYDHAPPVQQEVVVEEPDEQAEPIKAVPQPAEGFEFTRARGSSRKQQQEEEPKRKKPPGFPDF